MSKKNKSEISSQGVYADLGYEKHEEMATKADLVMEIQKAIKMKKLTQVKAAEMLGISQPKLCELLKGHFRGYSVERLIHFLNELGKDIDIVVRPMTGTRKARVNVYHSDNASSAKAPIAANGR
jgi:predicted XRE-type DNA-binding protein